MTKRASNSRVFPNLCCVRMSVEHEELTSAAPSPDGENAASLPSGASHDGAQEEREASSGEDQGTAAVVCSIPCAFDPLDQNRGADPALAGDLFDVDPTLLEDNPLFGTLARNQAASLFDHEEILRMASRKTIAQMAALYQQKYGREVKNKRISVRLDTAKDKVARARGCLRKDIVAAFEQEKRKYGVEKAKNMEAGRKRKARKQAAKLRTKKRKTCSIPQPRSEAEEEDDDSFPEYSDDEVAEMARQEKRGQLHVKPFVSKMGSKKRKRSPRPEPELEEDDEESLPDYSDEEMAEMARREDTSGLKVKEKRANESENESSRSSSPLMPPHLQRGAVESGEYTEEHAADALMTLSRS
ncbi:hypothetical protein AC578_8543 [Pseudocercospora eumusae]|uniref:Uncharacterized protein n=1 Tax=Pseudocercospora eumusae TaxID=321146 RepID=A0A139HWB6_9PEZI|nr:hypothetical protein AC578_8543 [Pseudocercospora eumusae]